MPPGIAFARRAGLIDPLRSHVDPAVHQWRGSWPLTVRDETAINFAEALDFETPNTLLPYLMPPGL
jgi:hypothetical protein